MAYVFYFINPLLVLLLFESTSFPARFANPYTQYVPCSKCSCLICCPCLPLCAIGWSSCLHIPILVFAFTSVFVWFCSCVFMYLAIPLFACMYLDLQCADRYKWM